MEERGGRKEEAMLAVKRDPYTPRIRLQPMIANRRSIPVDRIKGSKSTELGTGGANYMHVGSLDSLLPE